MSGHIADLVSREDLRDAAEAKIRELAQELDFVGDFDPTFYQPPGPVAQAFLNSTALTSVIMGPLGGGKTTACMFKRVLVAGRGVIAWHPKSKRPTRMCRGIVLRDTFRQTEKTVLESWRKAFPKGYLGSDNIGGNDRPLVNTLRFRGLDGVEVECITEFAGLGENSIGEMLKGTEYSLGWLNEVDTHAEGALDDLEGRLGRWPSADIMLTRREIEVLEAELRDKGHLKPAEKLFAPTEASRTLIGDMNAPTLDNWTYEKLVTNRGPDRAFFQQPSGMSPEAENIFALPGGRAYYQRLLDNIEERDAQRLVHNKFGYSRAGKPVHESFDHPRHVATLEIPFDPNADLHIGLDVSTGGLSPAAVFGQLGKRVKIIDELYLGHGVGSARFGEGLKQHLAEHYPNVPRGRVKLWFDPASQHGADKEAGELNAAEEIASVLKLPIQFPFNGSNALSLRLGAVDAELRGYLAPNTSLLISPKCKQYIAGIAGKYRFKRKPESNVNDFDELPEKAHPWSDLQDAGQYLIGGIRGIRAGMPTGEGDGKPRRTNWSSQTGEGATSARAPRGGWDPHRF